MKHTIKVNETANNEHAGKEIELDLYQECGTDTDPLGFENEDLIPFVLYCQHNGIAESYRMAATFAGEMPRIQSAEPGFPVCKFRDARRWHLTCVQRGIFPPTVPMPPRSAADLASEAAAVRPSHPV